MKRTGLQPVVARLAGACLVAALGLGACQSEQRVVKYKPFLSGIDGAQFGSQKPVVSRTSPDPTQGSDEKPLIEELPDGTKVIRSRSPRNVMSLLELLLDNGDDRTLMDQLISEKTRDELAQHGYTEESYLEWLHINRREIAKTFARMPQAENSPFVLIDQPGDRTWIIRLTGRAAEDVAFTRFWVRQEHGVWKFRWLDK